MSLNQQTEVTIKLIHGKILTEITALLIRLHLVMLILLQVWSLLIRGTAAAYPVMTGFAQILARKLTETGMVTGRCWNPTWLMCL